MIRVGDIDTKEVGFYLEGVEFCFCGADFCSELSHKRQRSFCNVIKQVYASGVDSLSSHTNQLLKT